MALLTSPADAMPWVGLYICIASVICTLAMAADVFRGFRQWKLWFPCRFFTLNAASITLIAIAMKLPVDLSTDMSDDGEIISKFVGIIFLVIMLANMLPSLGLMSDKELVLNTVALCILIVTINVNMWIQFVIASHLEEFYNNGTRSCTVWHLNIEVYCKWLQIDLQKKARKGKRSEEILQWLGDEAVKIVIQCKRSKNVSLDDHSLRMFIAASSMYKISQTILLHCNKQENWPTHEELFELISIIIADLLFACFTNLPRVITMKCHEDEIDKREDSIRIAAQLLGRSKKILKMLKARQLPKLDMDSMGYIDKWHALPKNQIANGSARLQLASSSSNEFW